MEQGGEIMKPWRDVYPFEFWNAMVSRYQSGALSSSSATIGRWFRSLGGSGRVLPQQIQAITRMLQGYHSIRKDDLGTFPSRIAALQIIATHADEYVRKYRINPTDAKAGRATTAGGAKTDSFTSMDAYVWSIGKRATRKAEYLKVLQDFYAENRGFRDAGNLIEYLRAPIHAHDGLCHLQASVRMEQLDPYHRSFEIHMQADGSIRYEDLQAPMNVAFAQWAGLLNEEGELNGRTFANPNPAPTPFFVWLENHPICTGRRNVTFGSAMLEFNASEDVTAIAYHRADLRQGDSEILWAVPHRGLLLRLSLGRLAPTSLLNIKPLHTKTAEFKGKPPHDEQAAAYVWTQGGDIFCGAHAAGKLPHTSFVSGKHVRCAGMIRISMGRVEMVSNNSGHYRPNNELHLKPFVRYLHSNGLFTSNAVVRGFGVAAATVADFLR
jgi:hypothetical protein